MRKVLSDVYFLGRKCIFCDKYGLYKLKNIKVKCKHCKKYYSLRKLKREIEILYYFYLEVSARKTAKELNFNYRLVHRKFIADLKKNKKVKEIEENKNHRDDNGRVINLSMWERYDKVKGELYYANFQGQTEYSYKKILSTRANAAFLMVSILSNSGESRLVQRELPAIIQHKSHECEFWYINDWMLKDGTDKGINVYENVAEMIANNASPDNAVYFLTHSIPGGCHGKKMPYTGMFIYTMLKIYLPHTATNFAHLH